MSELNIVTCWLNKRKQLMTEASLFRNSQTVAFGLLEEYSVLSKQDQEALYPVIEEWLLSDDNSLRYDACFLISQHRIRGMTRAVQKAITRCSLLNGPESHYEAKKLRRVLSEITEEAG